MTKRQRHPSSPAASPAFARDGRGPPARASSWPSSSVASSSSRCDPSRRWSRDRPGRSVSVELRAARRAHCRHLPPAPARARVVPPRAARAVDPGGGDRARRPRPRLRRTERADRRGPLPRHAARFDGAHDGQISRRRNGRVRDRAILMVTPLLSRHMCPRCRRIHDDTSLNTGTAGYVRHRSRPGTSVAAAYRISSSSAARNACSTSAAVHSWQSMSRL